MSYLLYKPVLNGQTSPADYKNYPEGLYARIAELLDGQKTTDEIISVLLLETYDIGDVMRIIDDLVKASIISESPESDLGVFPANEIAAYENQLTAFSKLSFDKGGLFLPYSKNALKHQRALKDAKIVVIGNGLSAEAFLQNLMAVGIGQIHFYSLLPHDNMEKRILRRISDSQFSFSEVYFHTEDSEGFDYIKNIDANLVVYVPEEFSETDALAINKECVTHKKDFLPYQLNFPNVFIGPFYRYKQSACFQCYTLRKKGAINDFSQASVKTSGKGSFNLPFGADMLCLEVIKYFTYVLDTTSLDAVLSIDIITGKTKTLTAFKLPRCPLCGVHKLKPAQKLWENI